MPADVIVAACPLPPGVARVWSPEDGVVVVAAPTAQARDHARGRGRRLTA